MIAPEEIEDYTPIERSFEERKLMQEVLDAFVRTQSYLSPYYTRWLRYYQMYRSISPERQRIWRANIFVPIPFAEVQSGLADMMEYWFGKRPMAPLTPREGSDYDAARAMEMYLEWERDASSLWFAMYEALLEMLIYGTGWQKVTWDWRENRNNVEAVSVWQIFPDCAADSVDDARWIIERRLRPVNWVRRLARIGVYAITDDELDNLGKDGIPFTEVGDQIVGLTGISTDIWRGTVEVIEAWLAEPPVVVTILNRRKVVRAHRNHFPHGRKPYVRWVDHHVKGEMFGIGELEVIEKLVHEINDIRNQRLDAVTLLLNNVLIANRMAGIDPDDLVMRPGNVIWANDVNAVKPLVQQAPIPIGIQEENISRFDIQQATGNWGYNQGQTPLRREAATTVLALQRAASKRYGLKLRMAEETAFRNQVQMRIVNAQHFLPAERWIRVTGEPPRLIRRDDIQGNFDYIVSVNPPEPKDVKRAQLAQILPILLQHPLLNQREFLDWLLDLYGLQRDKAKLLLDEDEALRQANLMAAARGGLRAMPQAQSPDLGAPSASPEEVPESLEDLAETPLPQQVLSVLRKEAGLE